MAIGDRPETGVFVDQLFLHPELDFEISFPRGWQLRNSSRAVGATAPRGEAAIFLSGDLPEGELTKVADDFAEKAANDFGAKLTKKEHVKVGHIDAIRYSFDGSGRSRGISAKVTFFPFAGSTWRMVGIVPMAAENRYFGPILLSMRSFASLSDEHRALIHTDRLRVVMARPGEEIVALNERTESILDPAATALLNGLLGNEIFEGGELMKVVKREN